MIKVILDSCCEITEEMARGINFSFVPFKITIDGTEYVDDENLELDSFLDIMKSSKGAIRTACPAPNDFLEVFEGDEIFVISITSELSGTYQSTVIAKEMYLKEHPNARVHIFDTRSAVSGETGPFVNIANMIRGNKSFDEIVKSTEELISRSNTVINLASLSNLAKNGRIPKIAGKLSRVLKIRAIAKAQDGKIVPLSIERGLKKSIKAMVDKALELSDKTLKSAIVISQLNAMEAAEEVKNMLLQHFPERLVEITGMKGLSSTYAEDGGLVLYL